MKKQNKKEIEKAIIKKNLKQLVFDLKRGFLQFLTLFIITEGPKYAYQIKADILKITQGGFDIDRNNLYKKLRALERDGILKSHLEPSQRGAQRKYYTLTPLGLKLLEKNSDMLFPLIKAMHDNVTFGRL